MVLQDQPQGQDQTTVIQESLTKKFQRNRNIFLQDQFQGQDQ